MEDCLRGLDIDILILCVPFVLLACVRNLMESDISRINSDDVGHQGLITINALELVQDTFWNSNGGIVYQH